MDNYVDIYSELDRETGQRLARPRLTPTQDTRDKRVYTKLSLIPVIFLPGIMGTNLKSKKSDKAVWRPPNTGLNAADVLGIVGALVTWGIRGPKKRQELLKAEDLTVDDRVRSTY